MKSYALTLWLVLIAAIAFFLSLPEAALGQSLTTGGVVGTVTDPSGAAVPNATVTLKNVDTGATQNATTNATGAYRFALLNPGHYSVSAGAQGFQGREQPFEISVGQDNTVNLRLQVASSSQTVEVTAEGGSVQTDNANVAQTITPEIISNIPNPGNDLTYYVQTSPGATMNSEAGYGNSATYGISATSNLFTVDGMNENDPFLNLSNSGATNLLLGSNDVQTASVVNNGYTGEYGTLAGANVNYVTKSGTNRFHGNAEYFWNGRTMNANDWFLNNDGAPRSFDNANQWAASIGGPIRKDKTFFFVDTEGLRLLIPTSQPVNIPSPQFQAATLSYLAAIGNAAEIPFYNRIFAIYNGAPGAARATNSLPNGGCDTTFTFLGGAPCALKFQSNVDNLTTEWLLTGRVDQNIGNRDRAFIHFRTDHGLQASITDPLSHVFNAQSVQPQYEGQLQETHQVGVNGINQLILSGSWYAAVFAPPSISAAIALMPYDLFFAGNQFASPGSPAPGTISYSEWPQGRNVTQYQISDDYAWQKSNHDLKFGVNFRRNDITDFSPGGFFGTIPLAEFGSEASFYKGSVDAFQQAFPARPTQPVALYSLGLYAQDEWAVRPALKVTLSLRAEHNSNPVCQTNCFSNFATSFLDISHDPTIPYNQVIQSGRHQAFPQYQSVSWEPRVGFAWQPLGQGKTVIRGGFGIFADIFPGTIASNFDQNSPLKNTFVTTGLVAPGVPGDAQSVASSSNSAFLAAFNSGGTVGSITSQLPTFSPPTFTSSARNIRYPKYEEWNFAVQQAIGPKMSVSVNYVGNHGYDLAALDQGYNAYCNAACTSTLGITSFVGLPATVPDSRFATITEAGNYGVSNYNGVTVSFTRSVSQSFQVQASYTWSHALDDVSNGGFLPFNFDTNTSILNGQDPYDLHRYNYGNSDYDSRQYATVSYVWHTPKLQNKKWDLLADWVLSGTLFAHTGYPFTVIDATSGSDLLAFNYGATVGSTIFANSNVGPLTCSSANKFNNYVTNPACMTSAEFTSPMIPGGVGGFGNQRRNQVYGPDYFDTDLTLMKSFRLPKWEGAELQVGAQAFNILNHPNFDQPIGNIDSSQFGYSVRTVSTPTSIFGSFLGADASPRALQIRAQLMF